MKYLLTVGLPEGWFVVQCPGKFRIFHDPFAETIEDNYDDLLGLNGTVYHPYEVVALAKRGAMGFRLIHMA
jgi:hypothetical protein